MSDSSGADGLLKSMTFRLHQCNMLPAATQNFCPTPQILDLAEVGLFASGEIRFGTGREP